ncbi:MAG: Undecaprenyl pyrophosphate synthetase [Evtepia sp.]|jgi:undecaprenyl diphosphate synthase|nr:Undecaprenyl pyrophosphate synthetase [Evtepia sp.]
MPCHVAIIMDGNGRWAKKRGLPRTAGHAAGAETFRAIATHCKNLRIPYLTVYAFSTENWKRPEEEVSSIMFLLEKYLLEAIEEMAKDKIKLCFFGDLSPMSGKIRKLYDETQRISKEYDSEIQVNICLNYGGRDEIIRAARSCAMDCMLGRLEPDQIAEQDIEKHLYSTGIPDPDLVIRPSGEIRISNFLLWQSAYAEYYFTDVLWPDFNEAEFDRILKEYQTRERRYGGV